MDLREALEDERVQEIIAKAVQLGVEGAISKMVMTPWGENGFSFGYRDRKVKHLNLR